MVKDIQIINMELTVLQKYPPPLNNMNDLIRCMYQYSRKDYDTSVSECSAGSPVGNNGDLFKRHL